MAELTKEQLAAIDNYGNEIQTLKDTVTAIRQLPGMYAAGKGTTGFLSLIREVAQNSIDQIVDPSSPADRASLFYNEQTLEVEVSDNGKGFPFNDMVRIVTAQHTSKNYTKKKGEYSSGMHGSGLKVVNALSTECHIYSYRYDGTAMQLDLKEGYVVGKGPKPIKNKEKKQGSIVKFVPSTEVLGELNLSWKRVYGLIKDIISLTPIGSQLFFEAIDKNGVKHAEHIINKDGIISKLINEVSNPLCKPIVIGFDNGDFKLDAAFCYDMGTDDNPVSDSESVTAFANLCPTLSGQHITGTIDGICKWFSKYMNDIYMKNSKSKLQIKYADIKMGLNVMISGFCLESVFVGQAKEQLAVPEMEPFCRSTIMNGLDEWSKANPNDLQKLCKFFKDMAELRTKQESGKSKIVSTYKKNPLNNLPAKYVKPEVNKNVELIIVEGDSAKAPVRDCKAPNQSIMPIRGKIINAFKCTKEKFFSNEEVQGITQIVFGQEYRKGLTVDDMKVDKIIIAADADVDGAHISALLLRMFVMYFPFVIAAGKLYKAVPPLYSIPDGRNKRRYFVDQLDIIKFNQKTFLQKHSLGISKNKSLTNKEISMLFLRNTDYVYFLEKCASTYAIDPNLLEMVLFHYVANKNSFKFDKLKKEISSVYRFMNVNKKSNTVVIDGTIDKYNCIICNERFINDCNDILNIINSNDQLVYLLDSKKTTIYNIMKTYESSIPSVQRYKGLGEMPPVELGESTILPENRTLIQYSLDDAKALLKEIREYESDTKKILKTIKSVDRSDLTE